jgi:anti-sigma factor RsiW
MSDADPHEEYEARFSDLHDGTLSEKERAETLAHLAGCEACKAAYAEFEDTMAELAKLKGKPTAPETFTRSVEDTIHRRSAGRFFGKKTLGDRVPFGVLLIVAMVVLLAIALVLWSSSTGSLRYQPSHDRKPSTQPLPTP